jgi:hypothetical protein
MGMVTAYRTISYLESRAKLFNRKFPSLERFEVHIRDDSWLMGDRRQINDDMRDMMIRPMDTLASWQNYCPTLKKVILYDVELQ